MNKNRNNVMLNASSNKTEGTMKKSLNIGFLVCLMSFALAISAYGADRLIVQDSGGNTKVVARDDGSITLNTNSVSDWSFVKLYGVNNGDNVGYAFDSFTSGAGGGGGGIFRRARGTDIAKLVVQNGDRLGFFLFGGYDGTAFLHTAGITAKVDGSVSVNNVPTRLAFEVGSNFGRAERMVINSLGYVGIGTSNPTYPLQMASGARCTTGGVWTNASSREYKENIKELSSSDALLAFNKLNPVTYNYKVDKADKHVGFIAEDVPDLVATPDKKALSPMDIVALLTKVVQEQQKTIAELNEKVNRMEQQVK